MSRARKTFAVASAILVCATAFFLLLQTASEIRVSDIALAAQQMPGRYLIVTVACTLISFTALGIYDVLAARIVVGDRVLPLRAFLTGAGANAISNTLGFHALTGSAIRVHSYRQVGIGAADMVQIVALASLSLLFGTVTFYAVCLALEKSSNAVAASCSAVMAALLVFLCLWLGSGRSVSLFGLRQRLPSGSLAALQMLAGAIETAAAIGALYVLLPHGVAVGFADFSLLYIGAVFLGIISHAPGGIGVFEATMISFVRADERAGMLAALLLYRLIYNIMPFAVATICLAGRELALSWKAGNAE